MRDQADTLVRTRQEEPITRARQDDFVLPYTSRADEAARRILDITVSCLCLLMLFPVALLLAVLIRLDSPGPVLFVQTRVGEGGREFPFLKFRSMCADAEQLQFRLASENQASGPLFKLHRDPRVTKVGRFMRRWSLDELPQLINVLRGEMSLVGPRPALPREVAQYGTHECRRFQVRPGLTGLWQISGRADLPFDHAITLDLEYIARRSVWFNICVLARTIPAVLNGRGAY